GLVRRKGQHVERIAMAGLTARVGNEQRYAGPGFDTRRAGDGEEPERGTRGRDANAGDELTCLDGQVHEGHPASGMLRCYGGRWACQGRGGGSPWGTPWAAPSAHHTLPIWCA